MIKSFYGWIRYNFYTIQLAEKLLASKFFLNCPFNKMMIRRGVSQMRTGPVELMIELTNACNLACLMCPNHSMKRARGVMSLELFSNIIDQAVESGIYEVKIAGMGEPLLDGEVDKKIAYAKKNNRYVKMFTNGMLLNRQKSLQLIESGVDEIFISIDGGSPSVLERIRRGSSYSQLQSNLKEFKTIRQELIATGRKIPEVIINVTYQDDNKNERKSIKTNWADFADKIRFFPVHNWEVDIERPKRAPYPCHLPFFQMSVCWDGRVPLCCIDYECQHQLGDITKERLAAIWQGEKTQKIRELHLQRQPDTIAICSSCSMIPNWFFSYGGREQ